MFAKSFPEQFGLVFIRDTNSVIIVYQFHFLAGFSDQKPDLRHISPVSQGVLDKVVKHFLDQRVCK